jgi:hypothetical protein
MGPSFETPRCARLLQDEVVEYVHKVVDLLRRTFVAVDDGLPRDCEAIPLL